MGENVLKKEIEIIDLAYYKFEEELNNIYLIFGDKTKKLLKKLPRHSFFFVEPAKLELGQDEKIRKQAFDLLNQIKDHEIKETEIKISGNSLPNLTLDEIRKLEKDIIDSGNIEWRGQSKDGNEILITLNKTENTSLTFSELFGIRMAMDILKMEEIYIVKRNSE
jgi:hypothetical protein